MEWYAASRLPVAIPGPLADLISGVAAIFQPHQLPCLPVAGCGAIIDGMTSAKHQSVIADHSDGVRSDIPYRAVQP
jgi:hypothetical protein